MSMSKPTASMPTGIPNELLKYEREKVQHWSQSYLAGQIDRLKDQADIDRRRMIRRWESGGTKPGDYYLEQLVKVYGRTRAQLGYPEEGRISFWHVPYTQNFYFTGRGEILQKLHANLTSSERKTELLPQLLCGRKGIGKTQIAIEYAYRHMHEYHTVVWLRADSVGVFVSDFTSIATLVELPVIKDGKAENSIIQVVKDWLGDSLITRWLLIIDNVENPKDLQTIAQYIPSPCRGHIILTTRLQSCSIAAQKIEVGEMSLQEGAELLLKRAKYTAQQISSSEFKNDYEQAIHISHLLGRFPAALEAAGAYIEETKSTLTSFVDRYQLSIQPPMPSKGEEAFMTARFVKPRSSASIRETDEDYPQWLTEHSLYFAHESTNQRKQVVEPEELDTDVNKELEHRYLERVIQDTYLIGLVGIPGLISQRVPLDQVFIPLQFHSNRPRVDYPLNDEEIREYRENQKRGVFVEDLERMLFEAEKNWIHPPTDDMVNFSQVWQSFIPQVPAVVIQGYPGMGKSTLMLRVALHNARVCLSQDDSTMGTTLTPARIPIILKLAEYAREQIDSPSLSLLDHLKSVVNKLNIPGIDELLEKRLKTGRCLVMLDGLDEASVDDPKIREQVQEEIKRFIRNFSANRFLITSRVAGYDQAAFPDYTHFLITSLALGQIEDFLPRWCHANVLKSRGLKDTIDPEQEASVKAEAERMAQGLRQAIENSPAVHRLAENPLLLTLMAIMHQNSIQLPQRRVELYDVITRTLLEHRNQINELPWIAEEQAIAYLGPLAYQMQAAGNNIARQDEVFVELKAVISDHMGGTDEQVALEAEHFLSRLRERGGIFVQRAGDYFGFFHRTFQEYFAARHILNNINHEPDHEIAQFIAQVQRSDDLWRESFLLAVAYSSGENKIIARKIIETLLNTSQEENFNSQIHALLLAADCLIEAKPFTIDTQLQQRIAQMLLQSYEQAQRTQRFDICSQIEGIIRHWLSILPQHAYQAALLVILVKILGDTEHLTLLYSTLTLLSMIAQELHDCRPIVFNSLIPQLLALAGLPAVGDHKPASDHPVTNDLAVRDLALTALCFMGQYGPTGLFLKEVRQHFEQYPSHLHLLARYSLEIDLLITPAVIPQDKENYRRYEVAIEQWIALRTSREQDPTARITDVEIKACLGIHQRLLDCAEEVCYPGSIHLLKMLKASAKHPDQPWQQIWQNYLLDQMTAGDYISYQEIILLWSTLFPQPKVQDVIAFRVLEHFEGTQQPVQRYAQHFIALLSNDLTEPKELRALGELRYLRYLRDVNYVSYLKFLNYMPHTRQLKHFIYLKYLNSLKYMKYLSLMRYQRHLRYRLFTPDVAQTSMKKISATDTTETKDLLAILFGRVRQIQESRWRSNSYEQELQLIAQVLDTTIVSAYSDEVYKVIREILDYLPISSLKE